MADRQGQGKEEQDDMYNLAPWTSGAHPNLLFGKGMDHLGVEDGQDTGDVSTVTVVVNNDTGDRAAQVAQASAGNNAATLPVLG